MLLWQWFTTLDIDDNSWLKNWEHVVLLLWCNIVIKSDKTVVVNIWIWLHEFEKHGLLLLPYWLSKTRMENLLANEGCAKKSATNMSVFLVLVMLLLSLRLALFLTISANMLLQFCLRLPNMGCHTEAVFSQSFSLRLTVDQHKKTWKKSGEVIRNWTEPTWNPKDCCRLCLFNGRPFPRKQFSISICWCFPKCKNLCLVFSVSRIFFWQRSDQNDTKRTFLIDQASSLCLWWEPFLTNKQHPMTHN